MDYELYHHGVLGQKWGIRRFQPYRPGEKVKGGKEVGEAKNVNQRDKKSKNYMGTAKSLVDASQKLVSEVSKVNEKAKNRPKPRMDLSNMTNQELQNAIQRENLELQYNKLFARNNENVSKGKVIVDNILEYGGSALAIGSSALAIALSVRQLKKK